MNTSTKTSAFAAMGGASTTGLPSGAPLAARWAWRVLSRLRHGTLEIQWPDGSTAHVGASESPRVTLRLRRWSVCAKALRSGDIGFAQSYMDGDWSTNDLEALLRLFLLNRNEMEAVIHGSWWAGTLYRLRHLLRGNSRTGSRKNIQAHYDLGNEFYRLWLDDTLNYSSAWFAGDPHRSMEQAQRAKMLRALDQAGVRVGSRVLEIGCGWGALAEVAARQRGARVTGVTLSDEQYHHARQRLAPEVASGQVDIRLQDYRDLGAQRYDSIVSIEMFEAVGRGYWDGYFQTLRRCLTPQGRACVQSIVIRDDLFEHYSRSTDFIQQYIFPGGFLPSDQAFRECALQNGLCVVEDLAFGLDYAKTLRYWRERFMRRQAGVLRLGFDMRFMRLWEFYLAYCEAAFATGNTNVKQYTLVPV
jgi:cyclopropane-fatty-acyl-phospholipid synthase